MLISLKIERTHIRLDPVKKLARQRLFDGPRVLGPQTQAAFLVTFADAGKSNRPSGVRSRPSQRAKSLAKMEVYIVAESKGG